MEFKKLKKGLQLNFEKMVKDCTNLFEVDLDKQELWDLYLASFPDGTNEIYRTRREYDCNCCKHFIKNIGNVVGLIDNKIVTIWDFETNSSTYQVVVNALSEYVKSKTINNSFISDFKKIGTDRTFSKVGNDIIEEHDHFYLELPSKFVKNSSKSVAEIKGEFNAIKNVFKRSLTEITEDSILMTLELIAQNSLYKGNEWEHGLNDFLKYKRAYESLSSDYEKDNYCWAMVGSVGSFVGKIRNHSIGTLLVNLSEDMDLELAVKKYEALVAPSNYKRPKAIFTKKMLEDARKTIDELGFLSALNRRHATINDININNILFTNKDVAVVPKTKDVFEEMSNDIPINSKKFNRVDEIGINDFINNVLPTTKSLEVLLENKHSSNMVSLITAEDEESNTMFKWDNNFSWAYSGNIADSEMKNRVKNAGGKVDGVLRFSIQWNDVDRDLNDLDAHCVEPSGNRIYFSNKHNYNTGGKLDVDIVNPIDGTIAVENITWGNIEIMQSGKYMFLVNQFNNRGGRKGFRAEIEFNGEVYSFDYDKELRTDEYVQVAEVTLSNNGEFTIKELLPSNMSNREIWGLKTNQFVQVSTTMYSPNYWDNQSGIGNKHYLFMLKNCVNDENPNGFYNEFLKEDLMKHKKVFEALGGKMKTSNTDNQLSGLGFSSTKKGELIVRVKGSIDRLLKIKF